MTGKIQIRQYMLQNVTDHVDQMTGEVNATSLAEDTFWALEPNNNGDIPDNYWDCAEQIAERHEIQTGVREGRCVAGAAWVNSRSAAEM